ncbi:MAG TPA: YHS domain-containing protein [Pirellulales bacterium]|nr:YHS domain-containing protein [Pirellulales bacterium]
MKTRLLSFAALAAFLLVPMIHAEDKADSAGKCPVSSKPAAKDHAVSYEGGKVYFCCDNCPKAFQANPAKFAAKAHHQMVLTGQLVETKCPFTGKDLNPEKTVEVDGVKVAFCCANCQAKAKAMTADDQIKKIFTDVSKSYKLAESK